ncbi:hypothetical protein ANCCAN_00656 [Ancylostoma caninum]|uniref:Uncharacterized protein n=1 Tax=Ancylostoma caninum TaxID=29170 RepID=A0A368HD01_ANCCA|nr:hypothetical protein ANCCAN_00656 [Ancylostoma caninum]
MFYFYLFALAVLPLSTAFLQERISREALDTVILLFTQQFNEDGSLVQRGFFGNLEKMLPVPYNDMDGAENGRAEERSVPLPGHMPERSIRKARAAAGRKLFCTFNRCRFY